MPTSRAPTVGIGYALLTYDNATKKWKIRENLKTQMSAIGKTVSEADKGILQKIADALNKGTKEDINTAKSLTDSSSFSFEPMTSDESKNLLVKVINDEYLSALKSKLGATLYDFLANSKEMVALLSIVYQGWTGAIKQPLIDALTDGTRTEIWYQIRYEMNTSNAGWMANRRYNEANEFGLYDGTIADINTDEAKEILQMYTEHNAEILAYEGKYAPSSSIQNEIQPAKTFLITNFGQGKTIDEVIVGQGLKTAAYEQISPADDIIMTIGNKNNLIFGEGGDDSIISGDGNDVIYGGKGDDFISGGKGNDILEGGAGNDDYYFSSGDGSDKINDNEGTNRIIWIDANKMPHVMKTFYKSGDAEWTSPDGTAEVNKHSPYKIVLPDGGIIELGEDISSFGINLLDTPANPVTTNTILGDLTENKNDLLRDTSGNDRIEGISGNDGIWAGRGGDNWILGGEGNDTVVAYHTSGSDIIEGGSGVDVLTGGGGDDRIFGENFGEMEDIITAGETAQSINEKGNLESGAAGNDFVYGSNKKMLLGRKNNKKTVV